ncbi:MAG: adenosylcobinamide-phosphate synthase [Acidimicrobiaceae bacterium]
MRVVVRGRAVALGLIADRLLGEPAAAVHPVALFGKTMGAVEQVLHRDRRDAGVLHAGIGAAIGLGIGLVSTTAAATYTAVAGKALGDAAMEIDTALANGDLEGARELLPALVGRDPRDLDERDVCRAVVESVAENTVDAVVAPVLWAMAAGGPGALGYRAVNTLDAMVGHHSPRYERFGWASARLDDAANFVPARVTAGLVALARPRRAIAIERAVLRDAPSHPSPNAGVSEAAFAAALNVRLGGPSRYGDRSEVRPPLGDGRVPERHDIARAVRLSSDVQWILTGLAVALPW